MSENNAVIQTKDVCIGFRKGASETILFENLNLDLRPGELVCFMGPNGIGKTTLIKTLTGLQKPLRGDIALKDNLPIALVLTDKVTATHMLVSELVSYGRYPYLDWNIVQRKEDLDQINKAIELTGIRNLLGKRLYELSDGQVQLAMLAKALAQDTPILFLDEPTAHLDLNNRVEIMNLLRTLTSKTGKTILVATHELDLALQVSDRIWLATNSRTIKDGIPEDLVLDGSFDEVFQFKGFDLKTGKIFHQAYQKLSVHLIGDNHHYLWTKNALERNGFQLSNNSPVIINIINTQEHFCWEVTYVEDTKKKTLWSLYDLINLLRKK
jgi:iron complex transport system ATP-binding protein